MNLGGFVKIPRSILIEDQWVKEPFTRGQAWLDLLMLANWKPGHITVQGMIVPIGRGEVGWSEEALSQRWKWSRGKVRRFFDELERYKRCIRKQHKQRDRRKSVITICDYDKYSGDNRQDSTGGSTGNSTASGTIYKKNNNEELHSFENFATEQSFPQGDFDLFWNAFSDKRGRTDAIKSWKAIKDMSPILVEQIVAGAQAYAAQRPSLIAKGQTPKMAQGWLTGRRWEDEVATASQKACQTCRHFPDQCPGKNDICSAYEVAA